MADILKELEVLPNDGVILGRRDSDYVAGTLPYQVRLLDGNWTPYIPLGELQYNKAGDSMSCVTFSALNIIETQEKFLTGSAPSYSDRWTAKVSGTTRDGNYLWKVADAIRDFGLVWEEQYPAPSSPWTIDEWLADIEPSKLSQLKNVGAEWKQWWTIQYEWVNLDINPSDNLLKALRQCPVQMVIPGHAVAAIYKPADIVTFLDSYLPWLKGRPLGDFVAALKIVLMPLKGQRMTNVILCKKGSSEYGFYIPVINPSALISQGLNFGIEIPKNADGSVSFVEVEKLVRGTISSW